MSSIINYVADGSTSTFQIPFNFIDRAHVVVTVDGTTITPTFINDAQLSISPTPTSGLKITVKRQTPVGALVDFTDGSTLFEADLDLAHKQNRFIAEESSDRADSAIDTLNANITNINTVAANTAIINTVSGSITNVNSVATNMAEVLLADTNAATATTKASEASISATASEASKVISVTKAGEASASAASALASKNAASTSETNAAGSAATATTQANLATTQTSLATTQANNSANSASTASTQAGIATTKASEASTSASAAAASAASITDEEANAAASASAAASSATASANSAAASAAALDTFDDRYLGSKTANPTLDNDGAALVAGALHFNSTNNEMRVYDGANWIAASSAGGASLLNYNYTATAGQTTFSGADDNAATLSYTQQNLIVTLNGIVLEDGTDYTASNGTSIVLNTGASAGDELNIVAFKSFTTADMVPASTGGTFSAPVTIDGNSATVLTVDRATSDGTIIDVQKNGSTVGSIGSENSHFILGRQDTGLKFHAGVDAIIPHDTDGAANRDAAIDLGYSSGGRFKDLYLSGGVYLGGTGAANKLDDYEEGTWTPVIHTGAYGGIYLRQLGYYKKVGGVVHFEFDISLTGWTADANHFIIGGLPFISGNSDGEYGSGVINYQTNLFPASTIGSTLLHIPTNNTLLAFYQSTGNNFTTNTLNNINQRLIISGRYFTNL